MTWTTDLLSRHRNIALGIFLALVVGGGLLATQTTVDNSLAVWFSRDDPALERYRRFQETFGSDEVVVTALSSASTTLQADRLERLSRLTEALGRIEGVDRALSLANAPVAIDDGGQLLLGPLVEAPVDDADVRSAGLALAHSDLARRFVGHHQGTLLVYSWLAPGAASEQARPRTLAAIRAAAQAHAGPDEEVLHAGMGVLYEAINSATIAEGMRFAGFCYLVIIVALLVITQRLSWTGLAVAAISAAIVLLLGVMAACGQPITVYTVALPALITVLGIAHVVHLACHATAQPPSAERAPRGLSAALGAVLLPCLVNALTTAGGFLSLTSARTAVTRNFGLFAAIGVLAAFVAFVICFNAAIPCVRAPRGSSLVSTALTRAAERLTCFSLRHRLAVLLTAVVATALCLVGISRIRVDTSMIDYLPDQHPYLAQSAAIEERAGPYVPLELLVTVDRPRDWKRAGFLQRMISGQEEIERQHEVAATLSVATMLRDLRAALELSPAGGEAMPTSDAEAHQLLLLLESGAAEELPLRMVSADQRILRVTATVQMTSAMGFRRVATRAVSTLQEALGAEAEVVASGYLPLHWRMADHVVRDQMLSFCVAFLVVFGVIALALRSWRLCLAAIPANLVPVAAVLGFMGYAGVHLDTVTVATAATILGIIVDDTIHLLYAARRALAAGGSVEEALRSAARTSGRAVLSTSLVFVSGFGVVACSGLYTISAVGLLSALAVATALLNDLMVLPATLRIVYGLRRPTHSRSSHRSRSTSTSGR